MNIFPFIYNEIIYRPLFNALAFLTGVVPYHDVGIAIIILTILVRIIIFPLTHRSLLTQIKMKELEPHINKIRETHKDKADEQGKKIMELYKEHGVNPLSGCFLLLIQLPILIALYRLFWKGLLSGGNLYSFISMPSPIKTHFLGLVDLALPSWTFAFLAAASQFAQMKLANPTIPKKGTSMREEMSRAFAIQSLYIFPALIFFISIKFPAALALYWTSSNLFATLHEAVVRRRARLMYGRGEGKN
ncbi:membrane protein insertase YidC [Candidatus Giovannonibacteria bacterium]|nr:membrane protein insertase YidC [Candidatus Giovannonibacteria bacterium]